MALAHLALPSSSRRPYLPACDSSNALPSADPLLPGLRADSPLKCSYEDVPVMKPSRLAEETLHAPRYACQRCSLVDSTQHRQPMWIHLVADARLMRPCPRFWCALQS